MEILNDFSRKCVFPLKLKNDATEIKHEKIEKDFDSFRKCAIDKMLEHIAKLAADKNSNTQI